MARLPRDSRLETRDARLRLSVAHEPYWKQLTPGTFVGYRKGPNGGVWIARVLAKSVGRPGGYLKKKLGTADDTADSNGADILAYREAFTAALEFAESLKQHDKPAGRYTVADAYRDYWDEHYVKEGRSPKATQYLFNDRILPALGAHVVADLTPKVINAWLLDLADAPKRNRGGAVVGFDGNDPEAVRKRRATANRALVSLRACLNHAFRAGRVPSDTAWRRVSPFKRADAPKVRYLSTDECIRLLASVDPDFQPMVRAGLLTGCRYSELTRLRVSDFDSDSGTVLISASKSGKSRHIPLTDDGAQWFRLWTKDKAADALILPRPDGLPWGHAHQCRRMEDASAAAKIDPPASFHILRHSYASHMASAGVPLQMISEALGHCDTRMAAKHYAHLSPNALQTAIRTHAMSLGGPEKNPG